MIYQNKNWLHNQYVILRKSQSLIAKESNTTTGTIEYWINKTGLKGSRTKDKYTINLEKLTLENPIFCYYIGLVATDGNISTRDDLKSYRVSIGLKNGEDEYRVLNLIRENFECTAPLFLNRNNYVVTLRINCTDHLNSLIECGIPLKNKDQELRFPTNMTKSQLLMYLRGCLDGDGSIDYANKTKTRLRFRICKYSEHFIKGIKDFIEKEYNTHVCYRLHSGKYPQLEFSNNKVMDFLKDIYTGYEEIRFNRKYNRYYDIVRTLEKSKELENKASLG